MYLWCAFHSLEYVHLCTYGWYVSRDQTLKIMGAYVLKIYLYNFYIFGARRCCVNKKYIIKRTLSNIRGDGLVRLLWDTAEVWVYYICILRITSSISTSSTSSQKSLFIHQQLPLHSLNAKHTSIGYQDTSSTVHIQSHFFNTLHVQNFQRVNQSALASPQKRFSITDMLLQACYTFCRSDWQHLDTTI